MSLLAVKRNKDKLFNKTTLAIGLYLSVVSSLHLATHTKFVLLPIKTLYSA